MVLPYRIGGMMIKHCNRCDSDKDISMFYRDKSQKHGIRSCCKKCDDATTERWREKNKDKYLTRQRKRWIDNDEKKAANKIASQKHRTEMSDMYIRSLMTKKSKTLKSEDITNEMIELCRANLRIKRELNLTPKLKGEEDQP